MTTTRRGRVMRQRYLTVASCREFPDRIFVFGDNLAGWGKKGQAVIRGQANAVGVPTKRYPARDSRSYLSDADIEEIKQPLTEAFLKLRQAVERGADVVLPEAGLGTGLAELPQRAPRIYQMIERAIAKLEAISAGE